MLKPFSSKALCALVLAVALAGFAGCGGGDDDKNKDNASTTTTEETTSTAAEDSGGGDVEQYKKDFQAAGSDFKDAAEASSKEVTTATDTAGRVKALDGLKDVVTNAADDFEALDPPEAVQADNDKLVSQFRTVADEVDKVRKALESSDQPAAAAAQRLQKAQADIGKTLASIESKVDG